MDHYGAKGPIEHVVPTGNEDGAASSTLSPINGNIAENPATDTMVDHVDKRKEGWTAYFRTKDFYLVLVLGYASVRVRLPSFS